MIAVIVMGITAVGLWAGFSLIKEPSKPARPAAETSAPEQMIEPSHVPPLEPTERPAPLPTNTPPPPSLPGEITIPIERMAPEIPWLPLDPDALPGTFWIDFKLNQPPFDNLMVRKAFVAAINREELINVIREISTRQNIQPATSLLPPGVLGRNLTGKIGIPFNPDLARNYLTEAGYPDGKNFPSVTIYSSARDVHVAAITAILQMWKDHLGIDVKVRYIEGESYYQTIYANPPVIYLFGWVADINDPENFMQLFRPNDERNVRGFANAKFNRLIDQAAQSTSPSERQELYIEAERILCEEEAVIIPLYHYTTKIE